MLKINSKYAHTLTKLLTKNIFFVKHVKSTMEATRVLNEAWVAYGNHIGINLWEDNTAGAHHDGSLL